MTQRPLRAIRDGDLSVDEVAAALGCSPYTVEAHLRRGRFPGAFRGCGYRSCVNPEHHPGTGRAWRIPAETVRRIRAELLTEGGEQS